MGNKDFMDCFSSSKLMEYNFLGNYFTWRGGKNFSIHSKIDHVSVNSLWMDVFSQFGINFGNHSLSDHSPIYVKLMINDARKKKKMLFQV